MRFIFLIFFAITPVFSMDADDDELELAAAVQASLDGLHAPAASAYGSDDDDPGLAVAVQASLHDHIPDPVGSVGAEALDSDEEEELLRALELSRSLSPKTLLGQLIQKGQASVSETDYLRGLNLTNASVNFIGYMVFLKNKDRRTLDDLMNKVDPGAWGQVYRKLGLGKRTASHVFVFLDEAKKVISRQSKSEAAPAELVDEIDHVLLELLSGKWGFSRSKPDPDVLEKLKSGATGIGRSAGNKSEKPISFASKIFNYFHKGVLLPTVSDPLLRKHRLSAFAYMANGYRSGLTPDLKDSYVGQLSLNSQPYFMPEDLKGFSLQDLVLDPDRTLSKIAKTATETITQRAVFDQFIRPLKAFVSEGDLLKLKAFLGTFDSENIYEIIDDESQLNLLKLFQYALQDKSPQEIQALINNLITNGFLPAGARAIEPILVESSGYNAPVTADRIYAASITKVRAAGKGAAEPEPRQDQKDFDGGLQLWLLEYFKALHENGYSSREAYIVKYPVILEGEEVDSGTEVTEQDAVKASEHMAVYVLSNQLKETLFPDVALGQKAVLRLTEAGAKVDLINEMDEGVLGSGNVSVFYADQIAAIRAKIAQYAIDPNILPAAVEKANIPSNRPKKPEYAVRGGSGISEAQKIQSRGRAIDALIKEGRISRSLKLPILLYLDNW